MSALLASAVATASSVEAGSAFEVRSVATGRGVFACQPIPSGAVLFGEDDWVDEAERRSFSIMTPAQFANLTPATRAAFLRFAYNIGPEQIAGTFHPEAVRHPVNFLNHSCEPNAGYDGVDHIVALQRIAPGEEIRMDYGTFSFSFDHDFTCACGAWGCRGQVRRDDWRALVRTGLRLPAFMRAHVDQALWG
jgi:SET domain-containing protein